MHERDKLASLAAAYAGLVVLAPVLSTRVVSIGGVKFLGGMLAAGLALVRKAQTMTMKASAEGSVTSNPRIRFTVLTSITASVQTNPSTGARVRC